MMTRQNRLCGINHTHVPIKPNIYAIHLWRNCSVFDIGKPSISINHNKKPIPHWPANAKSISKQTSHNVNVKQKYKLHKKCNKNHHHHFSVPKIQAIETLTKKQKQEQRYSTLM